MFHVPQLSFLIIAFNGNKAFSAGIGFSQSGSRF
jgi:hypothetical protein